MCTLSLSDIGELRDDWLKPPHPVAPLAIPPPRNSSMLPRQPYKFPARLANSQAPVSMEAAGAAA